MNGKGVAGRYDQLPNQYVPLHEECPEPSDRRFVSKITPRNFASLTTFMGVLPEEC